jgi:hypothetical protein
MRSQARKAFAAHGGDDALVALKLVGVAALKVG